MRIWSTVLALALLTGSALQSQPLNDDSINNELTVKEMVELLQRFTSVRSEFFQSTYEADGTLTDVKLGHFWVQKPNNFRLTIVDPFPELIVSNGEKLWFYEPQLRQVQISDATETLAEAPLTLLAATETEIRTKWTVTLVDQRGKANENEKVFLLRAKDPAAYIDQLELRFLGAVPSVLTGTDKSGMRLEVTLIKPVLDPFMHADLFVFNPPADTDILDYTSTDDPLKEGEIQ